MIVDLKKTSIVYTIFLTNTSTNTFIYNALLIKTVSMLREAVTKLSYSFENNNKIFL